MKPVVEVENLSKLYRLGSIGATSLRDSVQTFFSRRKNGAAVSKSAEASPFSDRRTGPEPNSFWALRDVSFSIHTGDIVGIVGRNGAGKSTLLKILSRITEPTSGKAILRGRVVSLLEIGTGFHPELTGRENIFLNGAILGMKRAEIVAKFDEIVEFSEVGKFIDTPVKRYSSGMFVRLAFAVAAHLEPEILIIDEVLAVGDAAFQAKCLGKMSDVARAGRTVLFVSHNMAAVQTLCTSAIFLHDGTVAMTGPTEPVLTRYMQRGGEDSNVWKRSEEDRPGALQFESARVQVDGTAPEQKLEVEIELKSTSNHRPGFICIDILNSLGVAVMQAMPRVAPFIVCNHGTHLLRVTIDLPPLIPGNYPLTLWVGSHNTETLNCIERALSFEIETSPTKDRTFPHTTDHGYVVPESTVDYQPGAVLETPLLAAVP